jgi:hypothetical protein
MAITAKLIIQARVSAAKEISSMIKGLCVKNFGHYCPHKSFCRDAYLGFKDSFAI